MPYEHKWTPETGWQNISPTSTVYLDDYFDSDNDWIQIYDEWQSQKFNASDQVGGPYDSEDYLNFIVSDANGNIWDWQNEQFNLRFHAKAKASRDGLLHADPEDYIMKLWFSPDQNSDWSLINQRAMKKTVFEPGMQTNNLEYGWYKFEIESPVNSEDNQVIDYDLDIFIS